MIHLRNGMADDLAQLVVIENEGFTPEEAATKEAFIERIEYISDSFIVAEKEGVIIGYINGPIIDSPYITDDLFEKIKPNPTTGGYQSVLGLAVAKHARGTGVARLLLNHLKELCITNKRMGITLTCKEHLIEFYEQLGYVNHGLSNSTHGGVAWYNLVQEL